MAVLGEKKFNSDPKKMLIGYDQYPLAYKVSTTSRYGYESDYWANIGNEMALLTSAGVANTYRTILNLSGKSGFLTCVCGQASVASAGNAQEETFKITVDGVETEIAANNTGMTYKRGYGRFYLMASYTHTARTETYYSRTVKLYDSSGDEDQWNDDHRVVSSFGDQSWLVPSSNAVSMSPLTCVRFETSLKVETKCTLAVAGAPSSYVFAQYVIT